MGKKDKKKGKGAEKTAKKTEKKVAQKLKKELVSKGEEDIESLIAKFQEEDNKKQKVVEEQCLPPSVRSSFTFNAHPDREELIMFGGEYNNGNKTFMYKDLFIYNIKKNTWSVIHCPLSPPPRCAHQAVTVAQGGGQLWIFGGEFASPTRSQFYHYRDLWVYHLKECQWEQVKSPGGPSARSGHRMVSSKKQLFVFGGFHESSRDYKYFNDVYSFDLENRKWKKLEPVGLGPAPRSGCQMIVTTDGKIIIYGGYSREKVKKEVDRGIVHSDTFILHFDAKGDKEGKWKWTQVKQSGIRPSLRCGFSLATGPGNKAYLFGGVYDEETSDETLKGHFYNDLYMLDTDKNCWMQLQLRGKQDDGEKKCRRQKKNQKEMEGENKEGEEPSDDDTDVEQGSGKWEELDLECSGNGKTQEKMDIVHETDDGIFTVKIGPQTLSTEMNLCDVTASSKKLSESFVPWPRMNAGMVIKHKTLYVYGGLYEDGDRQLTLSDFHSLDLHKLDEWHTLIELDTKSQQWLESESDDDDEEVEDEGMEDAGAAGEPEEGDDTSDPEEI